MGEKDGTKWLELLRELDTCAVSDALDALSINGAVSGIPPRTHIKKICGYARTIKLATPRGDSPKVHLGAETIASASSSEIVIVEQLTGVDAAGWGGVLSNAALQKGIGGVIVEGPARDIDECDEIGFAVFSRATTARTARGRLVQQEMDVPVALGEVSVHSGDLVIADSSGIAVIPKARIDEVLSVAQQIAEKERRMTADVRAGQPVTSVMGRSYEDMLKGEDA